MIQTQDAVIVGLSEVRNNLPSFIDKLDEVPKLILTNRGQPVAMVFSYEVGLKLEKAAMDYFQKHYKKSSP